MRPTFGLFGAPIPHYSALTSVGTELFVTPRWTLMAKFDGEAGQRLADLRRQPHPTLFVVTDSVTARDVAVWHIATLRGNAALRRFRSEADID